MRYFTAWLRLRSELGHTVSVFQARSCSSFFLQLTTQIRMTYPSLQTLRLLV